MKIGMIGLGKMGLNLVTNLHEQGFEVVAYDISETLVAEAQAIGAEGVKSLSQLLKALPSPRVIWLMVPSGEITKQLVLEMLELMSADDILIDGGNSFYQDSVDNYQLAAAKGVHFFDVGSSGGQAGARNGGNFMIGGDAAFFPRIEPIFEKIAEQGGYLFTGAPGSGHYLKMVHNGIEYGMMGAIGEGFELLEKSPYDYDNAKVANMWNHGSVIRSWLMELMVSAFSKNNKLENIDGVMYSSGEGRWTVEEGLRLGVPMPIITSSLMMRYRSLEEDTFTGKVVASLRNEFGGHAMKLKS
jgi:6-phosphogluconate dehydrogenase